MKVEEFFDRLEKVELSQATRLVKEMEQFGFPDQENYFKGRKECLEMIIEYYTNFIKSNEQK